MTRRTSGWLAMLLIVLPTGARAQSAATVINPSEARVQWTHDGVNLQYFDYWVDSQPRPELGAYEKVDATTYRHKLPPDLANGAHTVQVRACNLDLPGEKCTAWVTLAFTVDRVTTPILKPPTNLTIITIAVPPTERKSTP